MAGKLRPIIMGPETRQPDTDYPVTNLSDLSMSLFVNEERLNWQRSDRAATVLSVRIRKAWWVTPVVGLLNMFRACGLPASERLVWVLFSAGFKVEAVEG